MIDSVCRILTLTRTDELKNKVNYRGENAPPSVHVFYIYQPEQSNRKS